MGRKTAPIPPEALPITLAESKKKKRGEHHAHAILYPHETAYYDPQ